MGNDFTSQTTVKQLSFGLKLIDEPRHVSASVIKGTARTKFLTHQLPHLVLLPSDMSPLLPRDHLAHSVINVVRQLDLSGIFARYEGKRAVGRPAYDPVIMLTLIIYCYCMGQTSTRTIEKMAKENIPCRIITGNREPDHDTIANFLRLHRHEFDNIFQQVLEMVNVAGLVKLEHVSIDGSKIKANASKRKAMSYGRMCNQLTKLNRERRSLKGKLAQLKKQASKPATKKAANQLQQEIEFKEGRLAHIKVHKQKLEDRIRAQAEVDEKSRANKQKQPARSKKDPKKIKPKYKDQINFTDEESRIMHRSGRQFEQSYNAQIVVDSQAQIIVAYDVVQDANDKKMLEPMLKQVLLRTKRLPNTASADAGYFSEESLKSKIAELIELLVPPDRECHPRLARPGVGRIPANISTAGRMRRKLSTKRGKETYALRKCIVEPVYGQIKQSVLNFSQFSWRGLKNVRCEWALVCAAHNLMKFHRHRLRSSVIKPIAA
jgi:transposase